MKKKTKESWKKKKVILEKKKKKKTGQSWEKMTKCKKKQKYTVDYCCNLQYFMWGGTVVPPHYLDIS